jgi:hypothetical protein
MNKIIRNTLFLFLITSSGVLMAQSNFVVKKNTSSMEGNIVNKKQKSVVGVNLKEVVRKSNLNKDQNRPIGKNHPKAINVKKNNKEILKNKIDPEKKTAVHLLPADEMKKIKRTTK